MTETWPRPQVDEDLRPQQRPDPVRRRLPAWRTGRTWPTGRTGTVLMALAVVAVFAAAAFGYSLVQPRVYGAEAEILLTPRPELSDNAVDRAMTTQTALVTSPAVLGPVASRIGVSIPTLRNSVSAEMEGRSNILRISVSDRSSARALTITQLLLIEYLRAAGLTGGEDVAPARSAILTPARPMERLVAPRPWRALAGGALIGVLAAAVVVLAGWSRAARTRPARV